MLWLTDIFSLNDPSELKHGIDVALTILKSEAEVGPPELKVFTEHVLSRIEGRLRETAHYFITCFSANGNDLGQWRAYADNGCGYALGFDTAMLEKHFDESSKGVFAANAFSITYDDNDLAKQQYELIAMAKTAVLAPGPSLTKVDRDIYDLRLAFQLSAALLQISLHFKHPAYANEQEYRFLEVHKATAPVERKLRTRPHEVIRYRELDWKSLKGVLKEIAIGPALDPVVSRQFVEDCLRELLPDQDVKVWQSKIPYRVTT